MKEKKKKIKIVTQELMQWCNYVNGRPIARLSWSAPTVVLLD